MFYFNPDLAADDGMDDGDEALVLYRREDEDEEEVQYRELQLEALEQEAREVDGTGTVAAADRLVQAANASSLPGEFISFGP